MIAKRQTCGTDVEEAARIRLQLSPYRAIRQCSCTFDGETLRLCGEVPTYHYKQLAQVAVAGMDGVQSVINDIEVRSVRPGPRPQES
ncbi:MAG: hypothetical protein AB7F89_26440 [Pirellulaceae bacterium]